MDVIKLLSTPEMTPITTVDTHTCGEPTRIVIKGYPTLTGSLLEQRAEAKAKHDHLRQRLILEPRGHFDMYGAILRPETELTRSGEADIGVLFMTNGGYSTMCGHATIALGRFLVDTHDLEIFPARGKLQFDPTTKTVALRLHAPCGLLKVTVPATDDGQSSDPSRSVLFESVACFATALSLSVPIPPEFRWPELGSRNDVVADFSYGGAFYCLVKAKELGFAEGLRTFDFPAMDKATRLLKAAVNANPDMSYLFKHPEEQDLSFLYSVIVVDQSLGTLISPSVGAETGLCFFADQEIDRSPTGSGVSARLAAAFAHGDLHQGEAWTYHSLVSLHSNKESAFVGKVVSKDENVDAGDHPVLRTQVQGRAFYTGYHTFVVEKHDPLGHGGFIMKNLPEKALQ